MVSTNKWSLFESGHMYRFDCRSFQKQVRKGFRSSSMSRKAIRDTSSAQRSSCYATIHESPETKKKEKSPQVGGTVLKYKLYLSPLRIYLGFYVAFNTVQVISQRVVGRAEKTSTYSWSRFCTVYCRPTASNYPLSHLRPCPEPNPGLRGGRRECYHSATVAPIAP